MRYLKQISLILVVLFVTSISYASCMGPFCWDDTGAHIGGQLQLQSVKYSDGSVQVSSPTSGGGAGNPAGSNHQVQFNNNGVFGASVSLLFQVFGDSSVLFIRSGNTNGDAIDLQDLLGNDLGFLQATSAKAVTLASNGGGIDFNDDDSLQSGDPSAIATFDSSNKGVLLPRLSTSTIVSPTGGLIIFSTDTLKMEFYNGTVWKQITNN